MVLTAYVHMVSQPARSVAWLLKAKEIEHELVQVEFGGEVLKSSEYLSMNPNGLVPLIKDGDFSLFEGNAILAYLATKYGHEDLYPTKDLQKRAKVDQYLSWHHTNTRLFTLQVVRPFFRKSLGVASEQELKWVEQAPETINKVNTILEKLLTQNYIASDDAPTVADFSAYCEYDQLVPMGLLDLDKFPKIAAWIERMKQVPFHDEVRVAMNGFLTATGLAGVGNKTEA